MTPEEKNTVKIEIKKRISEAQSVLENLKEQTKPVEPSVAIGRLTRMDAIQQKNMAEANLQTNENLIASLQKVLAKIDDENFGTCLTCGKAIPLQRLIAVPDAKICVPCASKRKR